MGLSSFFKTKRSAKGQFLTLDIGTDYVKCLLFELSQSETGQKLHIVGFGKQPLSYLYTRGGAIVDYDGVKQTVSAAIAEALSASDSKLKDVIIGLSGEVTKGLVTTVRLTRPNADVPMSEKELSILISKIESSAFVEASKEVSMMTGNPDLEIDLTNSAISNVKLDGVYIKDPLGLTGEVIEIALFTAFSPSYHLKLLQKLTKELGLKIITITSGLYALNKSLIEKHEQVNLILMDVGGETTDVGIVFGGSLVATRTLSLGGRHITRSISERFGLSYSDAEEKKIRYSLGNLPEEENIKVYECVREVLDLWLSGIELLFSDFEGIKTFPSRIFLLGGGSSLKDLLSVLEKEPWTKTIPFKEPPIFDRLLVSDLSLVSDMTGKLTGQDDILPASLGGIYLEAAR